MKIIKCLFFLYPQPRSYNSVSCRANPVLHHLFYLKYRRPREWETFPRMLQGLGLWIQCPLPKGLPLYWAIILLLHAWRAEHLPLLMVSVWWGFYYRTHFTDEERKSEALPGESRPSSSIPVVYLGAGEERGQTFLRSGLLCPSRESKQTFWAT